MITDEQLVNWFVYHAPKGDEPERYKRINDAALSFARVVVSNTPPSADQSDALRKIREARMTANAAIATHTGPLPAVTPPMSDEVPEKSAARRDDLLDRA
jgi:hypothetical protein